MKNVYEPSNLVIKVSIIVPVYKVEPWLCECIDSLINQKLKEIEIICIDDGSPDNCGAILDEYAKVDDRVIVIHQDNQGSSCARNTGISLARGEYLTFADPDDYVDLDIYEYTYNIAHNNQLDVLEFGANMVPEDARTVIYTIDRQVEVKDTTDLRYLVENYYVWNKLYKTSMIKDNNVRFIPKIVYADNAFTLMMVPYIKRYQSLKDKFYYYRLTRPGSVVNTDPNERKDIPDIGVISSVCEQWRKCNVLAGNEDYVLTVLLKKYYWLLEKRAQADPHIATQILEFFGDDICKDSVLEICDEYVTWVVEDLKRLSDLDKT